MTPQPLCLIELENKLYERIGTFYQLDSKTPDKFLLKHWSRHVEEYITKLQERLKIDDRTSLEVSHATLHINQFMEDNRLRFKLIKPNV